MRRQMKKRRSIRSTKDVAEGLKKERKEIKGISNERMKNAPCKTRGLTFFSVIQGNIIYGFFELRFNSTFIFSQ